jgi:DNA repair exonuclease SbcCD nuclease subunit
MKIQFCSDLHLEFYRNRKCINDNPLIPIGDILIIAGDTDYLGDGFGNKDFFKRISDDFEQSYIIPGNHEYYGGFDVSTALEKTNQKILNNVTLINNDTLVYNGVNLIFSTMWSLVEKHEYEVTRSITDFHRIKYKGDPLSVGQFNELHRKSFEFIKKEIVKEAKKIVITHHLPSELCNVKEFKGSLYNEAFCIDKTRFIEESSIDYWIYGHSHRNMNDIELKGTKLVTNQMGYIAFDEHLTFKRDRIITL